MRHILRAAIFLALVIGSGFSAPEACPAQDPASGSITGRVMLDGKPASGVIIVATSDASSPAKMAERMLKPSAASRATTDSDGRYRIEGLPAGKYQVAVSSRVLVSSGSSSDENEVTVADGTLEGIDFSLLRAGVITGKVTDSDGHPVINERISINEASATTSSTISFFSSMGDRMYYTDDRGVYRVFGLQPGKYKVSAGAENPIFEMLLKRPRRVRTFYPGVADEARARPIELTEGAEINGIDIKLGIVDKGFVISGRIIDADTRVPVPDAMVAYAKANPAGPVNEDKDDDDNLGEPGSFTTTNARGEFRFEAVAPGTYKLETNSMASFTGAGGFYADPLSFEVQYSNIDKLELKIHRGASISGVIAVENADHADVAEEIGGFMLNASVTDAQSKSASQAMARISSDLSFRISGLKPGKVMIRPIPYAQQKFSVLRIERNGVPITDGFEIQGNEQITGVRIFLVEADCVIRGRVSVQGGTIGPGSSIVVSARLLSDSEGSYRESGLNSKGEFVLDNLSPGNYEVTARLASPDEKRHASTRQTVTVMSGIPAEVGLTLDLKSKDDDR
jgi:protocatechuate 3,4-dioxygenase beta subunit